MVGVGAWAIGGPWQFGWGPQDDDESMAALHKAFDAGVNWVDTAAVYGLGHSEEVVGQAVREHGGEVLVFTKCGRPWYGRENNEPTYDLRPETIRFELEQSLKRLGTDHVDLYQFHWPDTETGTPVEDSWATMADLVTEGKVRWAGVSNFDVGLLERCERGPPRRLPAAAVQPDRPVRRRRDRLVRGQRHRGAVLQPARVGPAHRQLRRRPGARPAGRRLAPDRRRVPPAPAGGQPRAGPAAGAGGRAPRGPGGRGRRRLGPGHRAG